MNFQGYTVECGANWISGLERTYDNPVWKLAKDVDLQGHRSKRDDADSLHAVDDGGNDVTQEYLAAVERFNTSYERAVELVAERKLTPQSDIDVKSILAECGWDTGTTNTTAAERAAEYNTLEVWVSDGLDNLSAAHDLKENANDVDLGQDEVFVEDPRGFNCILRGMVRDIKAAGGRILLDTAVKTIQYSPGDVEITATDTSETGRTQTSVYKADAVVSTVSLGVLQSDVIEFIPPLPSWKKEALNQIQQFNFGKVFVRFDTWPDDRDPHQLVFICKDTTKPRGYYPLWMRYRSAPEEQYLFMCYLGGAEARRVEALTEEQIKDEVEELFGNAFGGDDWRTACTEEQESGITRSMYRPVSGGGDGLGKQSALYGIVFLLSKGCVCHHARVLSHRGTDWE